MYSYGAWSVPISSKAFYKADKIEMKWNANGNYFFFLKYFPFRKKSKKIFSKKYI